MELYPKHLTAKEKFDLELARRSPNSAFVFGLVAAAALFFDFGNRDLDIWYRMCACLLLFVSVIRFVAAKKIIKKDGGERRAKVALYLSILLNAMAWSMITTPTFYNDKFISMPVYISTCLSAGFSTGAAASLAPVPFLGLIVQSVFLLAPVGTAVVLAYQFNESFFYSVAVLYVLVWLHSAKSLAQNHRDIKLAMDFEVSMRKSNEELRQSREELARETSKLIHVSRLTSLGEMAAGIAHEVNNPLAIIGGHVQTIKRFAAEIPDAAIGSKVSEKSDRILGAVQRISKIVSGLRTFSQQSDQLPMEHVRFQSIVDQTLEFTAERLRNLQIDLRLQIATDVLVFCRHVQISQVLINLINNSIDSIETQDEKWIELSASSVDDKLTILFRDSGRGISLDHQSRLFQPFFTTKEIGKGTGLGLSISKGIIDDHGGSIRYETRNGHTSFVIELPIEQNRTLQNQAS